MTTHRDPRSHGPGKDNVIPFPSAAEHQMPINGASQSSMPEVPQDGPEFIRRPMPVVVPPWSRSITWRSSSG